MKFGVRRQKYLDTKVNKLHSIVSIINVPILRGFIEFWHCVFTFHFCVKFV